MPICLFGHQNPSINRYLFIETTQTLFSLKFLYKYFYFYRKIKNMRKLWVISLLASISIISVTSCEKEELFVNELDFNGLKVDQITSLFYFADSARNILYFSRFVEDGTVVTENYFYCIIDNILLNTDVDILDCEDRFEWYFKKDGYTYFAAQGYSSSIISGTFRIDREGENFYTVVANFNTNDYKTISVRWKGYFSYSLFLGTE